MPRAGDLLQAFLKSRWFYWGVFAACAAPLILLLKEAIPVLVPAFWPDVTVPWAGDLGVNPAETLLHATGRHALRFLLLALLVTPIRRLTGWNRVQRVRRMVGLWSFAYALCHVTTYVALDQLGDIHAILDDVLKRKFIFSGMLAFVILLALAATSTNGAIRRLGRRWQQLHRLVYVAAVAGAVHFVWGQKADIREPLLWAGILAVLLGTRVVLALRKRVATRHPAVSR
ncbi:MAG TPA: protein-methionine-sulfoxide reductase heme-binding subunit MsrQ [Vicinamibacterales bacterium]|jgi:sulfoxide reductase heme-binding subunit YedZ|nr:protein-methionine-sulfoxide reductase heme-binding subunit MsrQ [Vicinamibacterales bacterium]